MKKFFKEFKDFAMKGNVLDMAIGVVIGSAFSAIVTSLVNNIITPLIGLLTGGVDLSDKAVVLRVAEDGTKNVLAYGSFLQSIIDFLIIAFSIFLVIKAITKISNSLHAKKLAEEEAARKAKEAEPKSPTTEELLSEILAELRKKE
ncbi:MAG: large-conductance mechanosensitive channel protein MscL [Clostridiales bacterium]|nr:large-conductance mechanosensitive channel protein MscL [Clostridiales bacterium]